LIWKNTYGSHPKLTSISHIFAILNFENEVN